MKSKEYKLLKIAEEAAELSQAAIKIIHFGEGGIDPTDPDHVNNLHQLVEEMQQTTAAFLSYMDDAKDTATYQACPYPITRLDAMLADAVFRQTSMAKILRSNNVITGD